MPFYRLDDTPQHTWRGRSYQIWFDPTSMLLLPTRADASDTSPPVGVPGARKSNTSTLLLTVTAENASLGDLQEPGTRSSHGPSTAGGNRAWVLIGASDQYRIVKETTNPMTLQLLLPASCLLLPPSYSLRIVASEAKTLKLRAVRAVCHWLGRNRVLLLLRMVTYIGRPMYLCLFLAAVESIKLPISVSASSRRRHPA